MRAFIVALVALGVLVGTGCGGDDDDAPSATPTAIPTRSPDHTPGPDSLPTGLTPGASPEEGISLSSPIPYPLPFRIGSRDVMLPTGSTLEDVLNDPGGEFITVRRGESHATFAGDTGAVLEWDVRPEDEADFEPLRN